MTERRPRILVTRAGPVPFERWEDYGERVAEAGGDPVAATLDSWTPDDDAAQYDGLLLTSGVDVDPGRYNEARSDRVTDVDRRRDEFELTLLGEALSRGAPVLAICRGHQLLNVAYGGSLLQHIEQRDPHRARRGDDGETVISGWHEVTVAPGSLLAGATGAEMLRVNSRHHQAVTPERVAPGLSMAAFAGDGIVEALEAPARGWVLSVQWHPEMAEAGPAGLALFAAFVAACTVATKRDSDGG